MVEPFSKEHNVVIGRNGTGKSNFFDAIRFGLLTSRFANLRSDERQALLHEGSGKHVMSAYVEIVFDNTDGRLPVDTPEVLLRRTIGVKKDEFFLNRRHIPKNDVIQLLESAGFSRSNPYYIVQQGKVNALALMKDQDRLELLKEVAGTRVYEDRRLESLKIIHDTASQREKIQEVITYIESRLAELEEEKDELKTYQSLDREKRALEYTMHEKELGSIRLELEAIERTRGTEIQVSNELYETHLRTTRDIATKEAELDSIAKDLLKSSAERRSALEEEKQGLVTSRFQIELEVNELREQLEVDATRVEKLSAEKLLLEQKINQVSQELNSDILPRYDTMRLRHSECEKTLADLSASSEALIAKQSRKSQFKTTKERDAYLNSEIQELRGLVNEKQSKDVVGIEKSMRSIDSNIENVTTDLKESEEAIGAKKKEVERLTSRIRRLKTERNDLSEERKEKWRLENQIASEMEAASKVLSRSQDALYSTMAYDVRRGLLAIKELDSSVINGGKIYGPLIELVTPEDDRFCTAMDEAAGGSLFHVVVDTDSTAAAAMRHLSQSNLGRVTFLPLNRLKVQDNIESYPRNDDVVPLFDKLEFNPEVRKAVLSAFSKKLLCRDLHTCAQYAENHNMDALTLDGDSVQRRGGLNGGYKDPSKSRTRSMQAVRDAQDSLSSIQDGADKAKAAATAADQAVSTILSEIQKSEYELKRVSEMTAVLRSEQAVAKTTLKTLTKNRAAKSTLLNTCKDEVETLQGKITGLETEIATPMQESLSKKEVAELRTLSQQISTTTSDLKNQKAELDTITGKKNALETELESNLVKRRDEITSQLESIASGGGTNSSTNEDDNSKETLSSKELDLEQATRAVETNDTHLREVESEISKYQNEISVLHSTLEELKAKETTLQEKLAAENVAAEKILSRRSRLIAKREDAMRDIRELGTLPMTQVETYASCSMKSVVKKLHKCNEKLKKYSHVNKKALDQYVSFSEQRSQLLGRKKELDEGDKSITNLIEVLDKRKDEAILRTFKGVSHHFKEVFRELVPTGDGKMIITKSSDDGVDDNNNGTQSEQVYETFTGVQIKVSFRGEGDSYLMQQLSGGQKALVALAFIFAIQRCDPAPFYLFDEIDQALDSTHRAAVAALIHRQATSEENPAQFITSTFRPEMVRVADKFYGIGHQNKISNVHTMSQNESLEFIANIMAEEEGVSKNKRRKSSPLPSVEQVNAP